MAQILFGSNYFPSDKGNAICRSMPATTEAGYNYDESYDVFYIVPFANKESNLFPNISDYLLVHKDCDKIKPISLFVRR